MIQYIIIFTSLFALFFIQNEQSQLDQELNEKWAKIEDMNREYFRLVTFERKFGEKKLRPLVLNYQKLAGK